MDVVVRVGVVYIVQVGKWLSPAYCIICSYILVRIRAEDGRGISGD